jgi:hypothetical protein
MKGAFGNEGALRFLIRIAHGEFVISFNFGQPDAFRAAA